MQKYSLITGVTGFLGSELAKKLLEQGKKVIGVSRSSRGFLSDFVLNNENFVLIKKDILDLSEADFKNYDVENVFHLASKLESQGAKNNDFSEYIDGSVNLTIKILDLAKKIKARTFVYASTMGVIGNMDSGKALNELSPTSPMTNYNLAKYVGEKLLELESLKNSETKFISIRFPSILGKNNSDGIIPMFVKNAINNEEIELYDKGEFLRNIIYVDDAVDIMTKTIQNNVVLKNYELFCAGAQDSLKMNQIAQKTLECIQGKSKIILSEKQSRNKFNIKIDISKAKKVLGFSPMTIEQAIEKYIKELGL